MSLIRKHWALWAPVLILLASVVIVAIQSFGRTEGHLIYCLDDTYIHMAIAKHFAKDGVWGVTPFGFSSSSSSLLWTLLLSGVYAIRVSESAPLFLNVLFAVLALTAAYMIFRHAGLSGRQIAGGLLILVFLLPLPMMVMLGMEHVLHALVTLVFAGAAARELSSEKPRNPWILAMLAPVVSTARYEGLFTIMVVCILLMIRRRWKQALLVGTLALLPVVVYGIISKAHGWYFLPNSVQLKGVHPELSINFLQRLMKRVVNSPAVSLLALFTAVCYFLRYGRSWKWDTVSCLCAVFIGNFVLHCVFGRFGWFYRYEMYLLALGTVSLWALMFCREKLFPDKTKMLVSWTLLVLLAFPVAQRSIEAFVKAPQACVNTYNQQYQMGLFARRFYQGKTVALNDIGAVNYLADIRCLDFQGLASMETAGWIADDYILDPQELGFAIESVKPDLGMVFSSAYGMMLPPQWMAVGEWTTPGYIMGGDATVSFYSPKLEENRSLIENLERFSSELPTDVIQSGEYTQ